MPSGMRLHQSALIFLSKSILVSSSGSRIIRAVIDEYFTGLQIWQKELSLFLIVQGNPRADDARWCLSSLSHRQECCGFHCLGLDCSVIPVAVQ